VKEHVQKWLRYFKLQNLKVMKAFLSSIISVLSISLLPLNLLNAQNVNDLSIHPELKAFGIPANVYTPQGLLQKLYFSSPVENMGTTTQDDVVLDVLVERVSDNEVFYTRSIELGSLEPQQTVDTLQWIVNFPADHFPKGEYQLRYHLQSATTDEVPENNTFTYPFSVTDSTFAKNVAASRSLRPGDDLWEDGEPHSWAIGNYYFIPEDPGNNTQLQVTSATVELTNATECPDFDIFFWLYEWNDLNQDGIATLELDSNRELFIKGVNSYTCKSTDPSPMRLTIPINIPNVDDGCNFPPCPVDIERGKAYIMSVIFFVSEDNENMLIEASEDNNYGVNQFIAQQAGEPYYTHALRIGQQSYYRLRSSINADSTHFGNNIAPKIELNINQSLPLSVPTLSAENRIQLFPLPATDLLQVHMDLENRSERVMISLFDVLGTKVASKQLRQIHKATIPLEIDHLAIGTYFLHINTDAGNRTMKVIIGE